jgi:putative PIN family toxin of toxin-antitoxin system
MANELRVVVDTGVVIIAMLMPRSVPRRSLDRVLDRGKLLISAATVEELNEVIRRPRFDRYVQENYRLEFLAGMIREAELVKVRDVVSECRDPRDDKFLELAISVRPRASSAATGTSLFSIRFVGFPWSLLRNSLRDGRIPSDGIVPGGAYACRHLRTV